MPLANRIGIRCLALAVLLWAISLPLHVAGQAALFGCADFLLGGLFGLCLAGITRTRRPVLIYIWLALACLTLWPLFISWPYLDMFDVPSTRAWHYITLLRVCLFVLGLPYPFALIGQHGPDPILSPVPPGATLTESQSAQENAETQTG